MKEVHLPLSLKWIHCNGMKQLIGEIILWGHSCGVTTKKALPWVPTYTTLMDPRTGLLQHACAMAHLSITFSSWGPLSCNLHLCMVTWKEVPMKHAYTLSEQWKSTLWEIYIFLKTTPGHLQAHSRGCKLSLITPCKTLAGIHLQTVASFVLKFIYW